MNAMAQQPRDDLSVAMNAPRAIDVSVGPGLRLWDHGGDGPGVLLLHGYLDTGRSFDAVSEALAEDARCLALDWRGHGFSGRVGPGGSYHLLDHLKDLSLLMDATAAGAIKGLQHFEVVVAHSMGGNVALLLAGARPTTIKRLLLLDALGPPAEESDEQPARLGRLLEGLGPKREFKTFASHEEARQRILDTNPGLGAQAAERMVSHALRKVDDGWTFNFDPRLRGPVPVRYPESYWTALCRRIECPTRLLRAEHGYVPEGSPTTERIGAIPQGSMQTLPGTQHHLHVERPLEVAHQVRTLLDIPTADPEAAG